MQETEPIEVKIAYTTTRKDKRKYRKAVKGLFENFSYRELSALAKQKKIKLLKPDPNNKKKRIPKTKSELKAELDSKLL